MISLTTLYIAFCTFIIGLEIASTVCYEDWGYLPIVGTEVAEIIPAIVYNMGVM